jgi:ferredoxin-NADP reductase
MAIPQTVFRPYQVVENTPLAKGMFRLVLAVGDTAEPLPVFQAGQWVNLRLLNDDGSEWAKAAYSIASAPSAGTERIELGIKIEGAFTKRLAALQAGDRVELQGPWGVFTLDPNTKRHVLIAGGIGVTPFVSMVREAAVTGQDVTLLYSCRTPEEAAYLNELNALATLHQNITIFCTCTRGVPVGWEGEEGRITNDLLGRVVMDGARYLLCGPDGFMKELRALLVARGIDPKQVKQESFG